MVDPCRGLLIFFLLSIIVLNNAFVSFEYFGKRIFVISTDVEKLVRYPAIHPINFSQAKLTSHYGFRMDPFSHKHTLHEGQDFSGKVGSSIFSTADGVVVKSKYFGSFGNYIEIDHQNGYRTSYGHLSKRHVKVGERVFRGQEIGTLGNTGRSTAPHLHYEVKYKRKRIDPANFYFDRIIN